MYDLTLTTSYVPAQTDQPLHEVTIGAALREAATTWGPESALIEVDAAGRTGRRWTFAELATDCERLALALSTRFAPGERVCIWAPNIPEWILMEYAAALAGLVLVTANPAYQVAELAYVLQQSGSVALFQVAEYRGNPMARIGAEATAKLPAVREVVDLGDHTTLFARGERAPALPAVSPHDAAMIQYTSGTTGFPKGAVLAHRSLTNNARFHADRLDLAPGAARAGMMPLFHTAGCVLTALGALQSGSSLYLIPVFDAGAVLDLIESERIVCFTSVPTMMIWMMEAQADRPRDLSSLEVVMAGGTMISADLVRRVRAEMGCDFLACFGQTETAPLSTMHRRTDSLEDLTGSAGQPYPQTEVSIRSVPGNEVVPVGEIGEICVRGYCCMIEYNDNPEATAATIDAEGWLHSGDLGALDSRGYLRVTGRVKEMIIRGGENHFPAEIENVLLDHEDVAEVAVVGLPDETWGEVIAAFVRPETDRKVDPEALKAHCRAHLSPQKTPTVWVAVEGFPLTGSGKIRKFTLRDDYLAGHHTPV